MDEKDAKTKKVEEREQVLVPVRRYKPGKEAEADIQEEPQPVKQRGTPRRWYVQ